MQDDLQNILIDGENILWKGEPDKFCYIWRSVGKLVPFALLWLLIDGSFISMIFSSEVPSQMIWFLIGFFALHLIPVWICVGKLITANLEYKNIVYAVTDKRVIVRNGFAGLDFENVNYTDIDSIRANVSIIEKIRNVGTLYISTSSGQMVQLLAIADPYGVYKQVNKVFLDMKADIEYPNALRPEHNPGYNTKYQ